MIIDTSPAALAKQPDAWQLAGFPRKGRKANLPKGFRLYSGAEWIRDFNGLPAKLTPEEIEFERLYWMLDLEAEPPVAGRYMSLTQRVHRYWEIDETFKEIKSGIRAPKVCVPRIHGAPVFLPNHGPSVEWMATSKAIWASLPANDSDIFDRPAETENPKHAKLATDLAPLLEWARMSRPTVMDSTSWLQADNDNHFDGEEAAPKPVSNRERRIRPGSSYKELRSYIAKAGPLTVVRRARLGDGGDWETVPTDPAYPARAGKLHLASGKTESAGERVEAGTVLYQAEKFGELLGPEPDAAEKARCQSYWTSLFTAGGKEIEPVRFIKRGKMRRKVLIKPEEQKALLAGPLPSTTFCRPGLPCGHEDIGAQFVGGWISATKGKAGVERWEDASDEMARRTEFDRWARALGPEMEKVMHLGLVAANFREIGEAFGKEGKNAERYGKRLLIAANSNSKKILAA
ncbi:hypothetical protein [Mesorhizobium sp. 8]|uniref:hypothetical protein n=1 Tax=Mesorhizobium sp. 8 TaxID=2584466 RepID=UPI00111F22C8|nr:hypothetical protein [Mesorhizobium sp. 8]QDB99775.1 hypothetical protein FGU64_04770 [Mesorhizobium sp. 8]